MDHPRWGLIQSAVSTRYIRAGEELYGYYGYDKPGSFPDDFPWYWEQKMKVDKVSRLKAKKFIE